MSYLPNIPPQYSQDMSTSGEYHRSQQDVPVPVGPPTVAPTEEPLTLTSDSPVNSSTDTLEKRSSQFKYGLGDLLQKSKDEIYQNLQDGREGGLRAASASTIDLRKQQATEDLITKTTANKRAPLTPEERDGLIQIVSSLNSTTDPNTVLETAYGK